ncbi:hypothetical protein HYFRA_00004296 [Hymenoscyphus fraxineus]|uniref:Transcription factor TFIIIC triple barrel domain-containing protein n=1 Tax=Hymenoscyphus fraxineus TaxID=746836 RepID=A0A9N9KLL4_9HELO|nr:hypothetical protein HYFRA_00004296 [Hymenoscyphus fraxineus]
MSETPEAPPGAQFQPTALEPLLETPTMPAREEENDSDEWEYEYSTTETETFYLSVDLTVPEEPIKQEPRSTAPVEDTSVWLNPMLGRINRQLAPPTTPNPSAPEFRTAGHKGRKDGAKQNPDGTTDDSFSWKPDFAYDPSEIQILGLESRKPVISFCGRLFQCEWTEHIGSELLFTRRTEELEDLPSIRHLPGNIDLLCINAARLVSEKLDTERVKRSLPKDVKRRLARRYDNKLSDPDTASQTFFLDKLAEAKREKGEKDIISAVVEGRPHNRDWHRFVERRLMDERAYWEDILENGHDEEELEDAAARLEEIDREQGMTQPREKDTRVKISRERKSLKHLRPPGADPDEEKRLRKKGPDGNFYEVGGPSVRLPSLPSDSGDDGSDEDRSMDEDEEMGEVYASDEEMLEGNDEDGR